MLDEQGKTVDAGPAPPLDFRSLKPEKTEAAHKLLDTGWLKDDIEKRASTSPSRDIHRVSAANSKLL
jgi:hypothetical protein